MKLNRNGRVAKPEGLARVAAMCVLGALLCSCSANPWDVAARGDLELLAAMVERNPSIVNDRNQMGKTPLHHAVTYRKLGAVEFLIAHGADVNVSDDTGMTPLHIAATLNRVEEAKALVRAGADAEAMDKFGDRPLHAAAIHGQVRMIEYLIGEANAHPAIVNAQELTSLDLAVRERKTEAANRLRELTPDR